MVQLDLAGCLPGELKNMSEPMQATFALLFFLAIIDLLFYKIAGKLYSGLLLYHIKDIVVSLSEELTGKGSSKKLCGTLISMVLIAFLIFILHGLHSIFSLHPNAEELLVTIVVTVLAVPVVLILHLINKFYISWFK